MMKKSLIALALMASAAFASAHPLPMTHYHGPNGMVIGNQIKDTITTTYERDRRGNQVRVVTTTRCTEVRRNFRNNHLTCVEREVTEQRFTDRNRWGNDRDHDGIPNRHDHDRDNDGIPNRWDNDRDGPRR